MTDSGWLDTDWRSTVRAWIAEQLAILGEKVTGEITQPHVRPWSTAMRVPTSAGITWFKANGPGTAHEARLLVALHDLAAEWVVPLLAVDTERGWSLTMDGGEQLRSRPGLVHWERALPRHAELQRLLTPRTVQLLELGVPDLRPHTMPVHYADILSGVRERLEELRALEPDYARWCAELAAGGIAPTLQHDDLHDNNILLAPDGSYRFFDWGDAGVAHPFCVLLVTLRSAAGLFDPTDLVRLRDAYLEPWTGAYDRADLIAMSKLAVKIAKVGRPLVWRRVLAPVPPAERAEFDSAVEGWFTELLEPDTL
jgi:hypothetical protein